MDKRDLEKLVKDADWKRLLSELDNESDARMRSTIMRLIEVFASARMDDYSTGKLMYNGMLIHPDEIYLLLILQQGKYVDSKCIAKTHHLKEYIHQIVPSLNQDEIESVKSALQTQGTWTQGDLELRFEHQHVYSA